MVNDKLRKPLIAIILILVIAIIAILTTVGIWKSRTKSVEKVIIQKEYLKNEQDELMTSEARNVCESPECVTLAEQLLNWRDPTVSPCDNFYRASCGNYIEHNLVDGTRNTKKSRVVKRLIKEFLIQNQPTKSKSEQTMKLLYGKCMELKNDTIFHLSFNTTMEEVLNDIKFLGPWPMIDPKWTASKFDLNAILSNMAKLGHYNVGLFTLEVRHGSRFGLVTDYNADHPAEQKMLEVISAILNVNEIAYNETKIKEDIQEVYVFYEFLKYNTSGLEKIQQVAPNLDFEQIFQNLLHPKTGDWNKLRLKIDGAEEIFSYFKINKTKSEKFAKILSNFVVFKFIENVYPSISYKGAVANDRACDDVVIHQLPRATLRAFVRNHFDRENLKIVSGMLEETRKSYLEIISNTSWLSEEGRRRASLKISKMKKLIGYPEEYEKEGMLDSTFETLHTSPQDSFYTISKKINRYKTELLMDFIAFNLSLDPTHEYMDVNAYYAPNMNRMSMMVPFFDDPNMDSTYPDYAKYAVTGDILGHEIGHSMDLTGSQWNEDGSYEKWMPAEDYEKYTKKIQCLRDQYDNYDDPDFGKNLESARVINEIIADRHGIDAVLHTYSRLNFTDNPKFIGFENTPPEKMMYHLMALDYCAPRTTYGIEYIRTLSTHPTNSFRVNGVFSNLKSFSKVFNCPIGSPMNPEKKCTLFVD